MKNIFFIAHRIWLNFLEFSGLIQLISMVFTQVDSTIHSVFIFDNTLKILFCPWSPGVMDRYQFPMSINSENVQIPSQDSTTSPQNLYVASHIFWTISSANSRYIDVFYGLENNGKTTKSVHDQCRCSLSFQMFPIWDRPNPGIGECAKIKDWVYYHFMNLLELNLFTCTLFIGTVLLTTI